MSELEADLFLVTLHHQTKLATDITLTSLLYLFLLVSVFFLYFIIFVDYIVDCLLIILLKVTRPTFAFNSVLCHPS